jgi:hypothetical protein
VGSDRRTLKLLVGTTIALSLVHYTDNYVNFDVYPQKGAPIEISRDLVWIGWLLYTGFGLVGYRLFNQGRIRLASFCLAVFSISGLISLAHYSAPGMSEVVWWRHVAIWVDIALGAAVLAFAIRAALRTGQASAARAASS